MHRLLTGILVLWTAPACALSGLDSQARAQAALLAAVQAMGGETELRSLRSVRRDSVEDWVEVGQGRRPWTGKPAADDLPAHSGFDDSESISFLDYAGNRYYESIRYADAPNDYALVVESGTPTLAFQSIAYMREKPFYTVHAVELRESERLRRFRRFPEGLLRMALDRPDTLIWLGTVEEGSARLEAIAFADSQGTQIRLYFDAASHRLIRSETVRGHRVYGDTTADMVYSDFRRVGALELPFHIVTRVGGIPANRIQVRSTALDAPASEDWFVPPSDSVAIVPPPEEPAVEALGDGVYLIRGTYNLMFAEFRNYVLLIEAPISESYAKACFDLVSMTVPGKPVRLVSTHFHFDHVGGVRTAVARGIPVLTTVDAKGVIERSLASGQAMRPDELSRRPRAATIEVAGARTVFNDGNQRVELYDFGPTPHVDQLLVAWFPEQKLLHVADIFDVLTPELVIAGVDGVVMERRIRELGLDVEQIVPMHGSPVTMDQLRRGLEIRRQYVEK